MADGGSPIGFSSGELPDAMLSSDFLSGDSNNSTGSGNFSEEEPRLVKPDDKYMCPVHKGLLRNAVQTNCGHRLCQTCVNDYLGKENTKMCPAMEDDCEPVTRENVVADPGFRKEIKRVLVYCRYVDNGCSERPQLQKLQEHVASCPYRTVLCPYMSRGCSQDKVVFSNLEKHQANCEFRPVVCDLCGQQLNARDKQSHDEQTCPETLTRCPFNCGIKSLKRKELGAHKEVCPNKPTECQYKNIGCDFVGDKKDVEKHELDTNLHFRVLLGYMVNSEMQKRQQVTEINELKEQARELMARNEALTKQIADNKKDFKLKIVTQTERMIEDKRWVTEQLTKVQEDVATASQGSDPAIRTKIEAYDRQLGGQEIRMTDMDLRFQMIETASYDGKLLWKIRDFTQRKRDAVQGRTVSLYSQPFYTSRFGYRMCARVYLNGDGIGRGTHMSLYFVVMKGEYDALLPWPFQHKVSLMLLDQSTNRRHLKDEFFPDPNSTSFRRPVNAEMNVASGCPLFVAHTVLDNPDNQYIKDDILFIKVMVDTSQLQPM